MNKNFLRLLFVLPVFFICGCGLETVSYIYAPTIGSNQPAYNTQDYTRKYFSFDTNWRDVPGVEIYGTGIYYKIYSNSSSLNSTIAAIENINTSTASSSSAAQALISRGYKTLGKVGGATDPFVSKAGGNNGGRVEIRLTNYQSDNNYIARITVNGSQFGTPRRNDNTTSFDFFRTDNTTIEKKPLSTDTDTDSSLQDSSNTFYVDVYAVNIGYDTTFALQYSSVLHLGTIQVTGKDN